MKKILMFACLFLLLVSIGTASAVTIGNSIVDRANLDGATNIAFIDPTLVFPTDGTLESFSFWLKGTVDILFFDIQIYRYTGTPYNWELVYRSPFSADGTFNQPYSFSAGAVDIQAGDVLGWWFGAKGGIIPFDYTGTDDVEWTKYWDLTAIITNPVVGTVYSFNGAQAGSNQKREYSISAEYTPTVPEPATMLLLGLGLVGLAGGRKMMGK